MGHHLLTYDAPLQYVTVPLERAMQPFDRW